MIYNPDRCAWKRCHHLANCGFAGVGLCDRHSQVLFGSMASSPYHTMRDVLREKVRPEARREITQQPERSQEVTR